MPPYHCLHFRTVAAVCRLRFLLVYLPYLGILTRHRIPDAGNTLRKPSRAGFGLCNPAFPLPLQQFFTLFALVPLFVSRIAPASPPDVLFTDSKGNRFFSFKRNRLFYLVGAQPLCLTHRRDALRELGLHNFVLDFSFCLPRRRYLHRILDQYHKKEKLEASTVFNHKAGLK